MSLSIEMLGIIVVKQAIGNDAGDTCVWVMQSRSLICFLVLLSGELILLSSF